MARVARRPLVSLLHCESAPDQILQPSSVTSTKASADPVPKSQILQTRLRTFILMASVLLLLCLTNFTAQGQTLNVASIAFGNVVVQTTSAGKIVTLTNTQTAPITINSISVSGDFAETSKCPLAPKTLSAGATCQTLITFTPSVLGGRTGTLTVSDNGSNAQLTVQLGGTGVTPVALSNSSWSFGNQVINTAGAAKKVSLTNYQTVPLAISGISTSGDFGQTSNCPLSPNTLAARSNCTVSIVFTPTALGPRSGTLTVNDNATNTPQAMQFSGSGIAPVALVPTSVGFGNQFLNSASTAKVLTLTNNQNVPVAIGGISASGDFAETSNCPFSPNQLAANAHCTISVTFTPTAPGARSGVLSVTAGAPTNPESVALTGSGVLPVSLSNNSLLFPSQLVTTASARMVVTVKNNQPGALTISGVSTLGDFAQTSTCPLSPNTLAGGNSCTISVTFTPTAIGTRTGTLTITDNASTTPQIVSLSGTGSLSGLSAISVTPNNPSLFTGNQQPLTATGTVSNHPSINVTNFVNWSSSAPSFAPVSSGGVVQALAAGVATISASYGSIMGQTTITVAPPVLTSITVLPVNPSQPIGAYQQFTAVLNYNDGSTKDSTTAVSWSSSSNAVATVNASGFASASSVGNTTIQASLGSVTGTTTLTVSQPSCTAVPPGLVGWWTGDGNTVDLAGNHSGTLQNGASFGSGEAGQAFVFGTSGSSVLIDSPVYSPAAGTLMFWFFPSGAGALTGSYAGGQNRSPSFLIDPSGNLNWEYGNLVSQSLGQVSPNQWYHVALTYSTLNSEAVVNVYLNGTLVADAVADVNTSWNPQFALGAYLGEAQPSFAGSIDEAAVFNQALNSQQIEQIYNAFSAGMCKPTLQSIAISPPNASLAPGLLLQFAAAGSYTDGTTHDVTTSVAWSTSDAIVATIDTNGLATAFANGNATVSAVLGAVQGSTSLSVAPSLSSIQVIPQNPTPGVGTVQSFMAIGTFSDGTQQDLTTSVSWTSSVPTIAAIASNGLVNCAAAGQSTITATTGSVSGSSLLTVTGTTLLSVAVNPPSPSVAMGGNQQFTAIGTFSDGSQQDVTTSVNWSSLSPGVATIASNGVATGLVSGQVTITATLGSVVGTANLMVTAAVPAVIQLIPQSPKVTIGSSQQLSAIGIYSDGSSADISTSVTWISSAPTVATMSTSLPGLAVSTGTGESRISASFGGLTTSTTLTVQDALVSLLITPTAVSVAVGGGQQFTATGTYASGIQQDLTTNAAWSSSTATVAVVSPNGLATTLMSGQTNIEASVGNVTASASVLAVSPDPLGTANGNNIACPSAGINGTCYAVAISCPNVGDFTGYVKVTYPVGTPLGTVLFSIGGNGTGLYENLTYGTTLLNTILDGGFTLVQISWGEPFANQPSGWQTGPGGIRALACRYATLAQWIYTSVHLANSAAPFCATGNSSGAQLIGLALTHYGLSSIFAMVEPTSGPPFARQDWACDCTHPPAYNPCGVHASFCVGLANAQNFIDPAYPTPVCSQEVLSHSTTNDSIFYRDSVVAPDSVLAYPNTFVKFLYGTLDAGAPIQGHTWASAITSSKSESCVADAGHTLPNYLDAAQQIASDILNYCKLPDGQRP